MSCIRNYCSDISESVVNNLQTISQIGSGAFANVDLAEQRSAPAFSEFGLAVIPNGQRVAIKKMANRYSDSDRGPKTETLREAEALIRLRDCSNVIYMYGVCSSSSSGTSNEGLSSSCNTTDLILEVFDINLHDYVNQTTFEARAYKYNDLFVSIIRAKAYMEALNLCHNDIKLDNILYRGRDNSFKLADFGLAKFGFEPLDRVMFTITYRPIEILIGRIDNYNHLKPDIWAMGLTFLLFLLGRHPFYDVDIRKMVDNIRQWSIPELDFQQFVDLVEFGVSTHRRVEVNRILDVALVPNQRRIILPSMVETLSKMMSIDPEQRPLASTVARESGFTFSLPATNILPSHPKEVNLEIEQLIDNISFDPSVVIVCKNLFSQIYAASPHFGPSKTNLESYDASIIACCQIASVYFRAPVTLEQIIDRYFNTGASNEIILQELDTTMKILLKFLNYIIVANPEILR